MSSSFFKLLIVCLMICLPYIQAARFVAKKDLKEILEEQKKVFVEEVNDKMIYLVGKFSPSCPISTPLTKADLVEAITEMLIPTLKTQHTRMKAELVESVLKMHEDTLASLKAKLNEELESLKDGTLVLIKTKLTEEIDSLKEEIDQLDVKLDDAKEEMVDELKKSIQTTAAKPPGFCRPIPNDCSEELLMNPAAQSGVYKINIGGALTPVYCKMSTYGYTGILRRFDGTVDFNKSYSELQSMVGSPQTEYWLGLDNIHKLTRTGNWELLVELVDNSTRAFAKYQSFKVGDRSSNYRLGVSGFDPSSTAGNSMTYANGYGFTTYDHDVDVSGKNCAQVFKGAWWFTSCHQTNPLGRYAYTPVNQGAMSTYADFMCWRFLPGGVDGYYRALKKIAFYIRKN